jgi:hypothetical protein
MEAKTHEIMMVDSERHIEKPESLTERKGASLAPESGPHEKTENLPMVVWLTGLEPYFNEFCLDAEEVMERLSIRRSRLTQIAGKELRVGRARIDRYIRPVFRPCDVEEYKSWTRPTASHQKSSEILNEAADQLGDQISELKHSIATLTSEQQRIVGIIKHLNDDQSNQERHLFHSLETRWLRSTESASAHQDKRFTLLQKDFAQIIGTLETLSQKSTRIEAIQQSVVELISNVQYQGTRIASLESVIQNQRDDLAKNSSLQNQEAMQLSQMIETFLNLQSKLARKPSQPPQKRFVKKTKLTRTSENHMPGHSKWKPKRKARKIKMYPKISTP